MTSSAPSQSTPALTYRRPGWLTRNVFNRLVAAGVRLGVDVAGARTLEVAGRTSGLPRTTPVNPLDLDGRRYLVAARGETEWVRNLRAAGGRLALLRGRRREECLATEVHGEETLAVVAAYVAKWGWEVGAFFNGARPDGPADAWQAEVARHPVFVLTPA